MSDIYLVPVGEGSNFGLYSPDSPPDVITEEAQSGGGGNAAGTTILMEPWSFPNLLAHDEEADEEEILVLVKAFLVANSPQG